MTSIGAKILLLRNRFTPKSVRDLQLWLDASQMPLADGAAVATWTDFSGNGRSATQGTGAAQPVFKTAIVGGKPVVRFDGTDDSLALPNFLTGYTAGEIFAVLKLDFDPPSPGDGIWTFGSSPEPDLYLHDDGTYRAAFGTTVRKNAGDPAPALTNFHLLNIISAAAEWTWNINGTQVFTTAVNTVGWTSAPTLGVSVGGTIFFDGDMAEIVLYSRKLGAGERAKVKNYLSRKYGVVVA